ncbi:MAG: hypothetical protein KAV82_13555 [Phycisphaerae bacterium]|nr:hypothetical protein [Phycisphaerae bacterium]
MGAIEETIKIHGADAVRQALDRIGDGAEHVGDKTEQAGADAKRAGRGFDDLGYSAHGAGDKLESFAKSMFGLDALLNLVTRISEKLKEIVDLRHELAGESTVSLESAICRKMRRLSSATSLLPAWSERRCHWERKRLTAAFSRY